MSDQRLMSLSVESGYWGLKQHLWWCENENISLVRFGCLQGFLQWLCFYCARCFMSLIYRKKKLKRILTLNTEKIRRWEMKGTLKWRVWEGHDSPEYSFMMNTTFVKAVRIVDCSHKNTQMMCRSKWLWAQLDLKEIQGHIRKGTKAQALFPRHTRWIQLTYLALITFSFGIIIYFYNFTCLYFIYYRRVCMACVWAQRIALWSWFSLPPSHGPGVKLSLLGLQRKPSPAEPSHRKLRAVTCMLECLNESVNRLQEMNLQCMYFTGNNCYSSSHPLEVKDCLIYFAYTTPFHPP